MALWLVRAGSQGQQEQKCLDSNFVTIGWSNLPNLSQIKSREELKIIYSQINSSEKDATINNRVGQIWNFSHAIKVGDIVALPSKFGPFIAFGEVQGSYEFVNNISGEIRHIIPVRWLEKEVPRKIFSQNILYSFGAFMTVCRIEKNNAEEKIKELLYGKKTMSTPDPLEIIDGMDIPDLNEASKIQILKFINENFKGHNLEILVEAILQAQGYQTDRTEPGADQGADILAGSGPMGFGSPRLIVEVKSGDTPYGIETVDRLRGSLEKFGADHGLLVSLSGFKSGVKKKCREAYFKIRLWDEDDLLEALFNVYSKLPETIQTQIPLQRTWNLVRKDEL